MSPVQIPSDPLDRRTFSILVREHYSGLMVYARALVFDESAADDLVQEAFVVAWKNLGRFDVTRDFGSWMRGIVRNKWRDYCRKVGRIPEVAEAELEVMEAQLAAWDEQRQRTGAPIFDRLENCLRRLPETLITAVRAFYYDELDGEAAARKLAVNAATLRKRLERARTGLRECLEKAEPQMI